MVRAFTHYCGTEPTLSIIFEFIAKLASSLSYWIATADRTAN